MKTVKERVSAGIELLGIERASQLDVEQLNVYSFDDCPLAQLFDNWKEGTIQLGITTDDAAKYGFDIFESDSVVVYDELTREWKRQLRSLAQTV